MYQAKCFLNNKPKPSRVLAGNAGLFFAGSGIRAISALVSIGGGSLTIAYLTWQNIEIKKAAGTSLKEFEVLKFTEHNVAGESPQGLTHQKHIYSVVAKNLITMLGERDHLATS